jgi:hypothetical protein
MFARLPGLPPAVPVAYIVGTAVFLMMTARAPAETSVHRLGRKIEKLKMHSQQALKEAGMILGDAVDHAVPQIMNVQDDDICEELLGGAFGIMGRRESAEISTAGSKSTSGHPQSSAHPKKDP